MIGKKINQLATELAPVSTDLTIIGDPISGVSKKITIAQLGAIFSGAVSFYDNFAAFPATGDINVIYCAKDTKKLYLWSGSAYVEVFPSQALLDTYQLRSEKGNANGYASLDSGGKVPISQLPSSIMEYKGTWNAATNTPTLANGTGDTGDVYICNVAGTVNFGAGPLTFAVGDYVIYSGSIWQRSSGAVGTVTSVAVSRSGDALAITGSPITTSGTINIGFAGNSTQYVNGAGNLVTFPGIVNEAQNLITEVYNKTGATLTKGTVVYINGGQGNLPTVTKALATGDSTSAQTYGIVRNDITNNNNGYVVVAGRISDLDTQTYTEGTQLYLSPTTAGTYTSTKPYAPSHLVYVGIVVRAHPTQGVVEVKIQNGYELDELHNVAAQTPTNNDGLFWESATNLWKNKSISTILGGTPITGSGNINAIPKFTATNVLGNSVIEDDGSFVSMRGLKINATAGTGNTINFQQGSGVTAAGLGYSTIGASSTTGFVFYIDQNTTSRAFVFDTSTITSDTARTYSMPNSNGTLALVSQLTSGTVTSVAALTIGTTGTDITSTVANSTTTPVITLNVPTASATNRGALSSADWTTFNNKQNTLTNPVTGTGTTNTLPKFTGASTIGNSALSDSGIALSYSNNIFLIGESDTSEKYVQFKSSTGSFDLGTTSSAHFISGVGSKPIYFYTNNNLKATLSAAGNLGLGVVPSAWGTGFIAQQIGTRTAITSGTIGQTFIGNNNFNNGTNWLYLQTGGTTLYEQYAGAHIWNNAASGTAGNAISFTQAMTLNTSGNLSIGNTNDTFKLDVSGTGRFTGALTGTSATFSGRIGTSLSSSGANFNNSSLYVNNTANTKGAIFGYDDTNDRFYFTSLEYGVQFKPILFNTSAATFSSSVTASSTIVQGAGEDGSAGPVMRLTSTNTNAQSRNWAIINTWDNFGDLTFKVSNAKDGNAVSAGASIMTMLRTGNVGIGTTLPLQKLHVYNSASSSAAIFQGSSNSYIQLGVTNESYIGNVSGALLLETGGSERMRITSGGKLLVGTTTSTGGASGADRIIEFAGSMFSKGSEAGYFWADRSNASNFYGWYTTSNTIFLFNGTANAASINPATGIYTPLSDVNKKKDFEDSTIGLNAILGLKPTLYRMKSENGTAKHLGFIAQQVKDFIPQAYIQTKGEKEDFIGIDDRPIIAALVKSVQELKAELDTIKNK